MASTYLSRTSSTPTNALKWTLSAWVKISGIANDTFLLDFNTDTNNRSQIGFSNDGSQPRILVYEKVSGSTSQEIITSRLFRDPSAWYHIVVSCDRTLATSSDRTKIYVNGVQETSFTSATYPTQNVTGIINTAVSTLIGKYSQSTLYFDGSMTHFHFIDGTAYDASTFGETDATTGIWKPKTAPSVTYGTNGFFLKFENSGSMGLDSSGNANNFTVNGNLTQTVDTPTNNFPTWNLIMNNIQTGTWSNGNLSIQPNGDAEYLYAPLTFGVSSGKWYSEHMITGGNGYGMLGAISENNIIEGFRTQTGMGTLTNSFGFRCRDGFMRMSSTNTAYGSAPGVSSSILGMALDMDNKKVYYSINGVWQNSGNPSTGTNGFDFSSLTGDTFLITIGDDTSSGYGNFKSNFGNGYFGTTAVSSATSDESGLGIFEYTVPSGYYALCTKNINTQG
jgi:hypothetical protein